jgi:GMP synthase (glutamine-hydrolysing)
MPDFDVNAFIDNQIKEIKEALGDQKALVAVSGGVDSAVSALLTYRAIGENLVCVFIDDNFMRFGEGEQVKAMFACSPLNLHVSIVNERQRFMTAVEGIKDAEDKRKAFRKSFYETLRDIANQSDLRYLVQGTIKADIDETAAGIKTQHNILEQIGINPVERFGFNVIEPVKSLYKYQVREVARVLGFPPEIAERQPFPGPGLSIRVVGEVTPEKLEELKKATFIVEQAFKPHNPSQFFSAIFSGESPRDLKVLKRDAAEIMGLDPSQIKAGFLNEKATGMIDGKRSYGSVMTLALRDKSDNPLEPSYDALSKILTYLNDNYPEATRLLYLVDDKEGAGYAMALRAVNTKDFLTADIVRLPWATLKETAVKILESCMGVTKVYYDVTPKPPATVEYE